MYELKVHPLAIQCSRLSSLDSRRTDGLQRKQQPQDIASEGDKEDRDIVLIV
jgi:hypothetical protein